MLLLQEGHTGRNKERITCTGVKLKLRSRHLLIASQIGPIHVLHPALSRPSKYNGAVDVPPGIPGCSDQHTREINT